MGQDAPADPAQPAQPPTPGTSINKVQSEGDPVLVLSPGVTLTLGRDALLLSGMFDLFAKNGASAKQTVN